MKRFLPVITWLVALLLIAFALLYFENDLLWKVQQYNLFLDTRLFFREQMLVPGGFLSYISCFFTQFFFHPWMGVVWLCAWWLLLMWLIMRTFRVPNNKAFLALVPVALLLIANMDLGYWHYFMRLRGYFFVPTIGTTVGVAMLWAFRALPENLWVRIAFIVVATVIGYPLFGIYALAAVLLMAIWTWRLSSNRKTNAILSIVALLCLVAVPLICYRYVYYQTNIGDIWTVGLPSFTITETYSEYYIPYIILAAFFLMMVTRATPAPSKGRGEESHNYTQNSKSQPKNQKKKSLILWGLQGILAVALIALVYHYWYKDENFHHELSMMRSIEKTDWEGVIKEALEQEDEPTRAIVMMRNIALARLDLQFDEMYNLPRGNKKPNTSLPYSILYYVFGKKIYYQYGLLNDCHRMSIEDGVEYGWRVETLEDLARCSLLSGEKQGARKILKMLKHTLFHGQWAETMQQLLDNPKQIAENSETGPISHMLHYMNSVGADSGDVESYVMNVLAAQNADDVVFQGQSILATLWLRDQPKFWQRFFHYARLKPTEQMPHIFQEAAYLFGKLENRPDLERMPFDKSVKQTYNAFMKEAPKYDGQSANVARSALKPFFGNTYFYEYYYGYRPN